MYQNSLKPVKLMLADDHQLIRAAFNSLLRDQTGLQVTGLAANGKELLELIKTEGQPDVVLLDIDMPVMSGRQCLGILKSRFPNIRVIILSLHNEPSIMSEYMADGASAYVHKNANPDELIEAIYTVHVEGSYIGKELSKALLLNARKMKTAHPFFDSPSLSPKEIVILKELCDGLSNQEIAEKLHISINTVGFHRHNIYNKTDSHNIAELMKYAIKNGLISI